MSTRAKQWLLRGAAVEDMETDYCIITNMDDCGYDFYIAYRLYKWNREHLYDHSVTGVNFMEQLDLENIVISKQTYVVFETKRSHNPMEEYKDIRQRFVSEWLPGSGYQFADGPELSVLHWKVNGDNKNRYVEIWIPVEKVK